MSMIKGRLMLTYNIGPVWDRFSTASIGIKRRRAPNTSIPDMIPKNMSSPNAEFSTGTQNQPKGVLLLNTPLFCGGDEARHRCLHPSHIGFAGGGRCRRLPPLAAHPTARWPA